jgi:hypothetical protein
MSNTYYHEILSGIDRLYAKSENLTFSQMKELFNVTEQELLNDNQEDPALSFHLRRAILERLLHKAIHTDQQICVCDEILETLMKMGFESPHTEWLITKRYVVYLIDKRPEADRKRIEELVRQHLSRVVESVRLSAYAFTDIEQFIDQ